jgi:hypothetical protein
VVPGGDEGKELKENNSICLLGSVNAKRLRTKLVKFNDRLLAEFAALRSNGEQ